MKKCPNCELNYIKDHESSCSICVGKVSKNSNSRDNNKNDVENYLLSLLKNLPQDTIDAFTKKDLSFSAFKIRLPLLIECQNIDKEHCQNEVRIGNSNNYRYYIKPSFINGKYYHICSQWTDRGTEESKSWLKTVKNAMLKK